MRPLDPQLSEILTKYGEDPKKATWDCHGVWVIYHKAIERIAAKAGITFEMPEVVEAKTAEKIVAIIARGFMGERSEWSFGEAAPNNNKNAYPYAMAEKRAKDRVILKLVGLHGLAYSEEEADDFKVEPRTTDQRSDAGRRETEGHRRSSAALKREDVWPVFQHELSETNAANLSRFALLWSGKAEADGWPQAWKDAAGEEINKRRIELRNRVAPDDDEFPGDMPSQREIIKQHPMNGM